MILSIYVINFCTPMDILFHESSQQWISQKYSIQCILIKPKYGKYFYPTLKYWLVPHRTSLKIFQLHKGLKYYFKRCKILLLFWFTVNHYYWELFRRYKFITNEKLPVDHLIYTAHMKKPPLCTRFKHDVIWKYQSITQ